MTFKRTRIGIPEGTVNGLCALICVLYYVLLVVAVIATIVIYDANRRAARAQHNHDAHHAHYQNWVNKKGEGCCNNQDCGELAEADERTTRGFLEVRIEGQWCPILPHHYLKSGNVPNASVAHVCAWLPQSRPDLPHPCQRLLCYQPRPLF